MQAHYCLVAGLTPVAGITLVTGVCLVTSCLSNHLQANSCSVAKPKFDADFACKNIRDEKVSFENQK